MANISVPDVRFTYTSGPNGTGITLQIREWSEFVELEFDVPEGVEVHTVSSASTDGDDVWTMDIPGDSDECPKVNPEAFIRRDGSTPRALKDDEMTVTARSSSGSSTTTIRLNG